MTRVATTTVEWEDSTEPHVDFDLHGIVGIRVLDARPTDVETLTRQIGPLRAPLTRDPDITIRFVDELAESRPMTYANWPDSAATEDAFYLLRGKDGVTARTRLPMDAIGDGCQVVCERRAGHVPHLLALVNLTALRRGVLPLHASAFTYRGVGVLATGWGKGGKTETLLAFAARGARYVGDEWVYLTPDGGMHGVPEPIRLWNWHIDQLPSLRADLSSMTRARLRALPAVASSAAGLAARLRGMPASVLRRTAPVVRRQAFVQVPPARLFGKDALALHGRVDHVLFVASHDRDEVTIEPIAGASVAGHMLASLEEERGPFLQVYRQFRFLFPERRVDAIEQAAATERRLLERYLADRPAHVLRHPYPVDLESLVGPVEAALGARS
jgi:hypothetical protein